MKEKEATIAVDASTGARLVASLAEDGHATKLSLKWPSGGELAAIHGPSPATGDGEPIDLDELLDAAAAFRDARERRLAERDPLGIRNMGYDLDEVEVELYEGRLSMGDLVDACVHEHENGSDVSRRSWEEAVRTGFRELGLAPERLLIEETNDERAGRADEAFDEAAYFSEYETDDDSLYDEL